MPKPDREQIAQAVWRAWFDGMTWQGRPVAENRCQWETLSDEDKALDRFIGNQLAGLLADDTEFVQQHINMGLSLPKATYYVAGRIRLSTGQSLNGSGSTIIFVNREAGFDQEYVASQTHDLWIDDRSTPGLVSPSNLPESPGCA